MEFEYQNSDVWATLVRLATSVGRLKVVSNLRAAADAQQRAFEEAGRACGLFAGTSLRDGAAQITGLRETRAAVTRCRAWLQVLASVTNEPETAFSEELGLTEHAARQLAAMIRLAERGAPRPNARSANRGTRGGRA